MAKQMNNHSLSKYTLLELQREAANPDWERREVAGFELRRRVEVDWQAKLPVLDAWLVSDNEYIRRAAVLACMVRKRYGSPPCTIGLLEKIEKVLNDSSVYVRKCTGPFVLGYLGYTYPDVVLPQIETWFDRYKDGHKYTCWNLASTFSQALGRRQPQTALKLLPLLADHPDNLVIRATVRSLSNVATVLPGEVEALCLSWLSGSDRHRTAELVLLRLKRENPRH